MSNPLVYTGHDHNYRYKISPSQFSKFIEKPWQWYQEAMLGNGVFEGSTSSVLGTVIHVLAEKAAKGEPVDRSAVLTWLNELDVTEETDIDEIVRNYPEMSMTLINNYALKHKYLAVEQGVGVELTEDIIVAGTIDRLEGTDNDITIVDYKTYHSKTKPKSIVPTYRYQLLTYAWILKRLGYNPTRMKLVFVNRPIDGGVSEKTGKPLKSYPSEVTELVEEITEDDMNFIDSMIELFKDTIKVLEQYPELKHVIFHDMRLKEQK